MKNQKGITLIALIITIIVMLILVGVSVTVALNGGLFNKAKDAAENTEIEKDKEQAISSGRIKIGDFWYDSIEAYRAGTPSADQETGAYVTSIEGLQETVTLIPYKDLTAEIKAAVDAGKVQAVLSETVEETETIAVIPVGFEVSTVDTEDSISEGLVVKDGANEFVWIPYTSASEYEEDLLGPTDDYNNQEILNTYYGTDDLDKPYYNIDDFDYETDKTNIETSINTYKGFYVGRYETTIDNGVIGSMPNKTVLTSDTILREVDDETEYVYGWWGLYKVQKDIYANDEAVFSSMITDKEWDLMLNYTGDLTRGEDTYPEDVPCLSGNAYSGTTDELDVSYNIYDFAGNCYELTLTEAGLQDAGGPGYMFRRGRFF